jgi:nucleotide-binding universal stress UspA family protein
MPRLRGGPNVRNRLRQVPRDLGPGTEAPSALSSVRWARWCWWCGRDPQERSWRYRRSWPGTALSGSARSGWVPPVNAVRLVAYVFAGRVVNVTVMPADPTAWSATSVTCIKRVVVGVDDSPAGLAALTAAIRLARVHEAELVAVRAWALGLPRHGGRRMRHLRHPHVILSFCGSEQDAASSMLVRRAFGAVAGGLPMNVPLSILTPEADPGIALIAVASRPGDMIVVGTRSGHPLQRLIHGSVSRYCSRRAGCPVLAVPAPSAAHAACSFPPAWPASGRPKVPVRSETGPCCDTACRARLSFNGVQPEMRQQRGARVTPRHGG